MKKKNDEETPKFPTIFSNNFREFLLKEYENIWNFYKTNYEIRDRWAKFYFAATGSVLGLLGALWKFYTNIGGENRSDIYIIIFLILSILPIFGIVTLFNDIALRKSRAEMVNAINLIRKGFWHNFPEGGTFLYYDTEPRIKSFGKRDFVTTAFFILIVSVNFGALCWFKSKICIRQFLTSSVGMQAILYFLIMLIILISLTVMIFCFHKKKIKKDIERISGRKWPNFLRQKEINEER
jgi:hypothetical protein